VAGSTTKKAVVRRYDREALMGYVNPSSYLQPLGLELLSEEGKISVIPYGEIKWVCFVRDFRLDGDERRTFLTRPKMTGLWVSFRFRDGDVMEGVMTNNLLQVEPDGFTFIPPDSFGNLQRVFAPRASLRAVEILGVVGSPLTKRKIPAAAKEQIGLFEET
jgi:hypothetical protein